MKGMRGGDLQGTLAREGLDMGGYARLAALWGQRMMADKGLAARFAELMK
jgi:hypothetical protein